MNNEPYKVSICVPIYGVEQYIARCVESLFEQTYHNIEYIFVNDCTQDKSVDILMQVLSKYQVRKPQVKIINHKYNRGLAAARNTGIDAVTSDYVMHVDSDDWIEKNAVELLVEKQIETGADYVMANHIQNLGTYRIFWKRPHIVNPRQLSLSLIKRYMPINVYGQLFHISLYRNHEIRVAEGVNMGEDFQQVPRLAYYATQIAIVDEFIYHNENTNKASYTRSSFNINKWEQVWSSTQIIIDFCQGKDENFVQAANFLRFKTAANSLITLTKGKLYPIEYKRMSDIVNARRDLWKSMPVTQQACFYLSNIYMVAVYVKAARILRFALNKMYKKIRHHDIVKP